MKSTQRYYCSECNQPTRLLARKVKNKGQHWQLSGKCSHCGTKYNIKMPADLQPQRGEGILDFAKRAWAALRGPRTSEMPPSARETLAKHADKQIVRIDIGRTPLSPILKGVINLIKTKQFDELYHLFMIIELANGTQLVNEKNEVISLRPLRPTDIKPDTETETIAIDKELTLGEFFERAKSAMGAKFVPYDAINNNCQDYIAGSLRANGLLRDDDLQFIKQDVRDLVPSVFERAAKVATDIAGQFNVLQEGEGAKYGIELHAVEFKKKYYDLRRARRWMNRHDRPIGIVHEKANTFWFNQTPRQRYDMFRRRKVKPGVSLIFGLRKKQSNQ